MKIITRTLITVLIISIVIITGSSSAFAVEYGLNADLPSPDHRIENGAMFVEYISQFVGERYTSGYCQMFVQECYLRCFGQNEAGGGCCATNAYQRYCPPENQGNWDIPLGAAVYFSGSSTICGAKSGKGCGQYAGHVGIYAGNNEIIHVWGGKIQKTSIDFVTNHRGYSYRGWGWQGNHQIPQTINLTLYFRDGHYPGGASSSDKETIELNLGESFSFSNYKLQKKNYTFLGWARDDSATIPEYNSTDSYIPIKSEIWYAVYKGVPFTITFHANNTILGIAEETTTVTYNYGEWKPLNAALFSMKNKHIASWNTMRIGWGRSYDNGLSADKVYDQEGSTVHLYAQWAKGAEPNPILWPKLSISGETYPTTLNEGESFPIRGIISTDYGIITEVFAEIDYPNGESQSCVYNPNEVNHDLQYSINNDLKFGSLPADTGYYTYRVIAFAEYGGHTTDETLISANFLVRKQGSTQQVTPTPGSTTNSYADPPINTVNNTMQVNVGAGSTLRFCSTVSVADAYEIGSIPNGTTVYVYGITQQKYEDRTWAKINYNGTDGWVNYAWLSQLDPTSTPLITPAPTAPPIPIPTAAPTPESTATPTSESTATPTPESTAAPTPEPTATPTPMPTSDPFQAPSGDFDWNAVYSFPDLSQPDDNSKNEMAHNVYVNPELSGTSGKFSAFTIDFKADYAPRGTYWALCNWTMGLSSFTGGVISDPGGAYAGLQNTSDGMKAIMSFWDIHYQDSNGNDTVLRAKRIYPEGLETTFSGEGDGVNYICSYDWKPGAWYRMIIECETDPQTGHTFVSQKIADLDSGEETLISVFDTMLVGSCLEGPLSQFMENYDSTQYKAARSFQYRNLAVRELGSDELTPLLSAVLSVDTQFGNKKGSFSFGATDTDFWGIASGFGADSVVTGQAPFTDNSYSVNSNIYVITPTPEPPVPAPAPQQYQQPTLSISEENAPSVLFPGQNFGIRGIITTDCGSITYVHGEITNRDGTVIMSGTYYPNEVSHDLRYSINNDLVFGNLAAGDYTYTVVATAINGDQQITQTLISSSFSVASAAPGPITGLSAIYDSDNTARLSWNPASNATSYEVQYFSRGQNAWTRDGSYVSGTSYVSTGLNKYDTWQYRVRAVNADGYSEWAEVTYTKP